MKSFIPCMREVHVDNCLFVASICTLIITRDTYTQCKPRARAFSKCGLVCMEVAVRTELQKGQLDTPYAEQNPIIVHNIIHIQTHNHFLLCNAIATYFQTHTRLSSTINKRVCLYRLRLRIAFPSVTSLVPRPFLSLKKKKT